MQVSCLMGSCGMRGLTDCLSPCLAWSGSTYAIAWHDERSGNYNDIYATVINAAGGILAHDVAVCTAAYTQYNPFIAWSGAAYSYVIAWDDLRSVTYSEIWTAPLSNVGVAGSATQVTSGAAAGNAYQPWLAASAGGLGLVWQDWRDSSSQIYFARLLPDGSYKIGSDVRLTFGGTGGWQVDPVLVWTGAEYGVFWDDARGGGYDIWFQRISAGGTAIGSNTQVTYSGSMVGPAAAFAKYGYMVAGNISDGANYITPLGCNDDVTPPSCPGGFVAYNITGTSATVGWLPSGEDYTDIAYYQVYRNALNVAKTSGTSYHDMALGLNTTYAYAVEPVNAAQMQNYGCTTTFYLKTNASLILMVDKSSPDARLIWTNAWMNTYNVFRGTNPQVMTKIGETAGQTFNDPNVLLDGVVYFYTVDEPGW